MGGGQKNNKVIFGVAGNPYGPESKIISSIVHLPERIPAGDRDILDQEGYCIVQSLDACCFMMSADIARKYGFWEGLSGIHMCIEELCFRLEEDGLSAVVIPAEIWHMSEGKSLDSSYYREALKVWKRHTGMEYFNTTCMQCKVDFFIYWKLRYWQVMVIARRYWKTLKSLKRKGIVSNESH